jgi:hypothetical protein
MAVALVTRADNAAQSTPIYMVLAGRDAFIAYSPNGPMGPRRTVNSSTSVIAT